MDHRGAKGGFTLTELLVSTAIFAILMTSIAALFVASLHAVRAGYQSQEAFETSRGTFNVLERDLTTVFTSRDFGQYYQFYGNEYGMTMVGLLQLRDSSGREYSRIGRITYVIYPVVLRGADGAFYVTEPFALDYNRKVGISDPDTYQDFHRTRGVRYSGNDENSDVGSIEVGLCALIRYVEPGVSDLDSYPFDWNVLISETENNPEFPANTTPESIRAQLMAALNLPADVTQDELLRQLGRLESARDQMLAAKKRDLWLRMLSCQKYWIPKLISGVPLLPNPWGRINLDKNSPNYGKVIEPSWLKGGSMVSIVDPRDFVAVDNIGVFTNDDALDVILGVAGHQDYWTTWPLMAYAPKSRFGYRPFFEFGRVTADTTVDLVPFWNSNYATFSGNCDMLPATADYAYDYDQDGTVRQAGEHLVIPGTTDPAILELDPQAYERDGRDNNANSVVDEAGETFVNPVQVLIEHDGRDNDYDGVVDESEESISLNNVSDIAVGPLFENDGVDNDGDGIIDEPDEARNDFTGYSSPLQPRIPEAVMVRLPMVFDPAYLKAPNFERSMEQLIDVPTAYTRSHLAYETP